MDETELDKNEMRKAAKDICAMCDGFTIGQFARVMATVIAQVGAMVPEIREQFATKGIDSIAAMARHALAMYDAQEKENREIL